LETIQAWQNVRKELPLRAIGSHVFSKEFVGFIISQVSGDSFANAYSTNSFVTQFACKIARIVSALSFHPFAHEFFTTYGHAEISMQLDRGRSHRSTVIDQRIVNVEENDHVIRQQPCDEEWP
jgi:hypothetical protein